MNSVLMDNNILNLDKSSWKLTKVGDLAKDISKRVDNPGESEYDRFVGLGNFVSGDIKIKTWETTKNIASTAKKFQAGDILFARRNAYLRRASLVDFDGCCSGDAFVLRENHEIVVPGFLAFLMNSNALWDFANSNAAGTMSKRVKWRDLAEYEFFLPPKEQQTKLAELFWSVDDIHESNNRLFENINLLFQTTRKEKVLGTIYDSQRVKNVGDVPKHWKLIKMNDVFERITTKNKNLESNNVLTISAIDGLINQEEYFNKSVASKNLTPYYLLNKGDFAYNKSYSNGYPAGAIKRLNRYQDGVVSPLYICFRSKKKEYDKYYEYFFDTGFLNSQILSVAKEGARNHGLLNITASDFSNLKLFMPPLEDIAKIIDEVSFIEEKIKYVKNSLASSKALQKSLINQVF